MKGVEVFKKTCTFLFILVLRLCESFIIYMIINNFELAFCDSSFILTRNLWVGTKDVPTEELSAAPILRLIIQTLRKIQRDYEIRPEKFVMIADKWDSTVGGYYVNCLTNDIVKKLGIGGYKSSRKFVNAKVLEEMRSDPNVTPEQLAEAEREYAVNQVKFQVKKIMREEFPKIGIPWVEFSGYEFDQICTLAAFERYGKTELPDLIITKDTDLLYSLTPGCKFFSLPTRGSEPKIVTYEEMYYQIPEELRNKGMSLYQYNAYLNAFGKGHNDLARTLKKGYDPTQSILDVASGNYECIEPDRLELFQAQLKSYDLSIYPKLEEVKKCIIEDFPRIGEIPSTSTFREFCQKYDINGISDRYFSDFVSVFDQKLFTIPG